MLPKVTNEADNERIIDALLQFERGKWSNMRQDEIPPSVIRQALAVYDPAKGITFNPWKRTGGQNGNRALNGNHAGDSRAKSHRVKRGR